jgi:hypothetical protein
MTFKAKFHVFKLAMAVSSILIIVESLGAARKFH